MTQIRQFFRPQNSQIYAECGCTELRSVGTEFHGVFPPFSSVILSETIFSRRTRRFTQSGVTPSYAVLARSYTVF